MYSEERRMPIGGVYVVRASDGAIIPADPANADWQTYQAWRAAGNPPPPSEAPAAVLSHAAAAL